MSHPPEAIELTPTLLRLRWPEGTTELAAPRLRAACRCGGCRAHRAPTPDTLQLVNAMPVGHYAVNLVFSDGHDRGIYPWAWLRELEGLESEGSAAAAIAPSTVLRDGTSRLSPP